MTVLKSQAIEPVFLQHRNSCIPCIYFYCRLQLPVAHKRTRVRVRCIIHPCAMAALIHYHNFIVIHIINNINYHYCTSVCACIGNAVDILYIYH